MGVQQEIAKQISEKLQLKLSGEDKINLARRQTQNSEAYQLYLKGRYEWNRATEDGLKKSIEFFEQSDFEGCETTRWHTRDSADAYWLSTDIQFPPRESMPKAGEAAQKALQLDDRLGEAHISLAVIYLPVRLELAGRRKEFRQAVELSPSDAESTSSIRLVPRLHRKKSRIDKRIHSGSATRSAWAFHYGRSQCSLCMGQGVRHCPGLCPTRD